MKKITFVMLGITLALFLGLSFFVNPTVANTVDGNESDRDIYLNIITCNKPQYDMVKAISGNKHNIEFMFSNEKECYDFKYTNETIDNISNMDLFFYTGNELEPWSNSLIGELKKGKLGIINVSRGIRSLTMQSEHSVIDNPYYWTGLDEYKIALYNVKSAIQDRDPRNRNLYEENYNNSIKEIDKKIAELSKQNKDLKEYVYIALDDNMDYFYRTIGISPIKLNKGKPLDDLVKESEFDPAKVIVLKDSKTEFSSETYKVVNLDKHDERITPSELLIRNLTIFYENIPKIDNK